MASRPTHAQRLGLGGRAGEAKLRMPGPANGVLTIGFRMNGHASRLLHGDDPSNVV
ncbi:MAG: hypothetical protein ACK55I_49605 [bacterium]